MISAINALTLKPARSARWLKPVKKKGWFSRAFDAVYTPIENGYTWCMRILLKVWWLVLLVFLVVAVGTGWWYKQTPEGFLPDEDQGYVVIAVQLPDAASIDRTTEVTNRMNNVLRGHARRRRTGSCSAGSRSSTAPQRRTPRPRSPRGRTGRLDGNPQEPQESSLDSSGNSAG